MIIIRFTPLQIQKAREFLFEAYTLLEHLEPDVLHTTSWSTHSQGYLLLITAAPIKGPVKGLETKIQGG